MKTFILSCDKDLEVLDACVKSVREFVSDDVTVLWDGGIGPPGAMFQRDFVPFKRSLLEERFQNQYHAGWYWQQFVKMSIANRHPEYFVVDGDVVFLEPYKPSRRHAFLGGEISAPQKATYERLTGLPGPDLSLTAPHQLIDSWVMLDLFKLIQERSGCEWHQAIINQLDTVSGIYNFSEFYSYNAFLAIKTALINDPIERVVSLRKNRINEAHFDWCRSLGFTQVMFPSHERVLRPWHYAG